MLTRRNPPNHCLKRRNGSASARRPLSLWASSKPARSKTWISNRPWRRSTRICRKRRKKWRSRRWSGRASRRPSILWWRAFRKIPVFHWSRRRKRRSPNNFSLKLSLVNRFHPINWFYGGSIVHKHAPNIHYLNYLQFSFGLRNFKILILRIITVVKIDSTNYHIIKFGICNLKYINILYNTIFFQYL